MSKDLEGVYVRHVTHINMVNQLTAKIRKQEEQIRLLLLQQGKVNEQLKKQEE